jgi:hypothetical protein
MGALPVGRFALLRFRHHALRQAFRHSSIRDGSNVGPRSGIVKGLGEKGCAFPSPPPRQISHGRRGLPQACLLHPNNPRKTGQDW